MSQSTKALHIVEEGEEDEFSKRYIEINTLIGGKSFGDLALIG